jgi:hypothetical protein
MQVEKGAAPPPTQAAPPQAQKKKRPPVFLFIILVVVCCLGFALIYFLFFRGQDVSGTVSGVGWERTVEIEGLGPVEYSDWDDRIPAEAEVLDCQEEVRSIEDQPQPNSEEVCGTPYSVDTGSGFAEVVQDCEYHVYDDYCSYTLIEWSVVDTARLQGNDFYPDWPEPDLTSDERLGVRTETYLVYFDAGGENYTYSTGDFDYWQGFDIGSQWNLEVNALGGVLSIEP